MYPRADAYKRDYRVTVANANLSPASVKSTTLATLSMSSLHELAKAAKLSELAENSGRK